MKYFFKQLLKWCVFLPPLLALISWKGTWSSLLIFFHLFYCHSCIFPIIPFCHASLLHSSSNLNFIHLFNPPFIHHLQAVFVRRFFSCSCRLRRLWKVTSVTFDPWLQLHVQLEACAEALNFIAVHAVNTAAPDTLDNLLCVSYKSLKSFNLSVIHFWTRLRTFLTGSLYISVFVVLKHSGTKITLLLSFFSPHVNIKAR